MGFLDNLLKSGNLGAMAEMAAKNPQLVAAAASLLSSKAGSVGGTGGLAGVIASLQKGGLGDVAASWVGTGANKPIDPAALAGILGNDTLGQFAKAAGIGAGDASGALASLLPALVDQVTPKGQVPDASALEGMLGSLLGGR